MKSPSTFSIKKLLLLYKVMFPILIKAWIWIGLCNFLQAQTSPIEFSNLTANGTPPTTRAQTTTRYTVEYNFLSPPNKNETYQSYARKESDRISTRLKSSIRGIQILYQYKLLFFGATLQLYQSSDIEFLAHLPYIKKVWPEEHNSQEKMELEPELTTNSLHQLAKLTNTIRGIGKNGRGIKVGVIDSGIDYSHPALGGCFGTGCRVRYGRAFVKEDFTGEGVAPFLPPDDNEPPMDFKGHGTMVAGVIGGQQEPMLGVAPEVEFGAYRVFGTGNYTLGHLIASALEEALSDGMDIVNLSISSPGFPDSIVSRAITSLTEKGVVVIGSAGNDGQEGLFRISSISTGDDVISVGSVNNLARKYTQTTLHIDDDPSKSKMTFKSKFIANENIEPSTFSSWGPSLSLRLKPDVMAPGSDINSTSLWNKEKYSTTSGTSFSSPYIAGVAALYLSRFGKDQSPHFQTALMNNAIPVLEVQEKSNHLASVARQGAGLVNVEGTLTKSVTLTPAKLELGIMTPLEYNCLPNLLTLFNHEKTTKMFRVKHQPALAIDASDVRNPKNSPLKAKLSFALDFGEPWVEMLDQLIVPPGGSVKFLVKFSPEDNVSMNMKLLLSGYVEIHQEQGNSGESAVIVRVPYLGLSGNISLDSISHISNTFSL